MRPDVETQIDAGWHDWFCEDEELPSKTMELGVIVAAIAKSAKLDQDKQYVFFTNNCPLEGPLYDMIKICDRESGTVLWAISIGDRRESHRFTVYNRTENDFKEPVAGFDAAFELIDWFMC